MKIRCLIAALLPILLIAAWLSLFLPYPGLDRFLERQYSSRFYDRSGRLIHIMPLENGIYREWLALDNMPPLLPHVFIASEDKNFYRHNGIDAAAVCRAAFQNFAAGKTVSGASTITMQLARLVSPSAKRSLRSKLIEMWNALRIEIRLSKDQILEQYLNSVPFGFRTEGVASAAKTFFSRPIQNLTAAQVCALAVIPRRPSYYDVRRSPEAALERAKILAEAVPVPISENEWETVCKIDGSFNYPSDIPHFMRYVKKQMGADGIIPPDVMLTVDIRLCRLIQEQLAEAVSRSSSARISNGSALVIDNRNGEILAWIGSTDFSDDSADGQIDGVFAEMQPGSSMKPFLYALALDEGMQPQSVLPDVQSEFGSDYIYMPKNFNGRYNGPVSVRTALASSLNVPAVRILQDAGIQKYGDILRRLHFASLDDAKLADAGLGLALGSGEVSLYELVRAFSVFPCDGEVPDNLAYIRNGNGDIERTAVFSSDTARIICSMLSDKNARALGFGSSSSFETSFPAIFKTGTANQFQDIVALGATAEYTAGVWMGNFSGKTVIGKTGSTVPAAVVNAALSYLTKREGTAGFKQPYHYTLQDVCALSGMHPSENCPAAVREYVPSGTVPAACTWHTADPDGLRIRYPAEYAQWLKSEQRTVQSGYGSGGMPLSIVSPLDGAVFFYDNGLESGMQKIRIDIAGGSENTAKIYCNSEFIDEIRRPFSFWYTLSPGTHRIEAECGGERAGILIKVK